MSTQHVPADSVVVGFDGSVSAEIALDWAADEAAAEHRALVVAHAAPPPGPSGSAWLGSMGIDQREVFDQLRDESQVLLNQAADRARAAHPDLTVHQVLQLADARTTLLELAHDAHLVVVGSRGLGPVRSLLLGSVSVALTKHAACPVVVARAPESPPVPGGVLVAVEITESGEQPALELAFEIAAARALPITVLHCFWDVAKVSEGAVDVPDDEPGLDKERGELADAVRHLVAAHPTVAVHLQLTRGFVDRRLLDASQHADLIVVGHRAKPFLDEVVYGSVAPVVVEHAHCSVVVVPLAHDAAH